MFDWNRIGHSEAMGEISVEVPNAVLENPGKVTDWWQALGDPKYGDVLLTASFFPL